MNFRLLLSCCIWVSFLASAMEEEGRSSKLTRVCKEIQRLQVPELEGYIAVCLSHKPMPKEMTRADFEYIRTVCVDQTYAPLLAELVKVTDGKRIVDPNGSYYIDYKRYYLLSEAAYHRAHANAKVLLEAGAEPNCLAHQYYHDSCYNDLPIVIAIDNEDINLVRILLDKGARLHMQFSTHTGCLPLMRAVQKYVSQQEKQKNLTKAYTIIEMLLQKNARPDEKQGGVYKSCNEREIRRDNSKEYFTARELAQANDLKDVLKLFEQYKNTP